MSDKTVDLFMCLCSVTITSDAFNGKKRIERHKMVYSILEGELNGGVHALSLKLQTPQEQA